jgi:hypothetical protein
MCIKYLENLFKCKLKIFSKIPEVQEALRYIEENKIPIIKTNCTGMAVTDFHNIYMSSTHDWKPLDILACISHEVTHIKDREHQAKLWNSVMDGDRGQFY